MKDWKIGDKVRATKKHLEEIGNKSELIGVISRRHPVASAVYITLTKDWGRVNKGHEWGIYSGDLELDEPLPIEDTEIIL